MNDTLIMFGGGQCNATSCGSSNPIAAMIAQTMLAEMNQFSVLKTQDVTAQSFGNAAAIAAGGISV